MILAHTNLQIWTMHQFINLFWYFQTLDSEKQHFNLKNSHAKENEIYHRVVPFKTNKFIATLLESNIKIKRLA